MPLGHGLPSFPQHTCRGCCKMSCRMVEVLAATHCSILLNTNTKNK